MHKFEIRVARDHPNGGIKAGDELTFFYPSSEWSMSQPFECKCGAGEGICKGTISGAKEMGRERLKGYWLNPHIEELLDEMEGKSATNGAATNGNANGSSNGVANGAANGDANGDAKKENGTANGEANGKAKENGDANGAAKKQDKKKKKSCSIM